MIGRLERVAALRAIWETEPRFSDWLVSEEGIEVLARDVGIEVENTRREERPGDYPCDIVGNSVGDENHIVIIENQFGRTDHDHLGKLMTYAAGNRATTAVWIAESVSDDHRKVIDWLNDNTPPHLNFYLACVRAFRIGNSPVAPQLEVVCRPNLKIKEQRVQTSDSQSGIELWRYDFWTRIHAFIGERNPPFRLQSPSKAPWSVIAVGRSGFHVAMLLLKQRGCISVQFVAEPPAWRDSAYQQLQARKSEIENQLGQEAIWECKPNSKRVRIILENPIDPAATENAEVIMEWFNDTLRRFHKCFVPVVRDLKAPSGLEDEFEI